MMKTILLIDDDFQIREMLKKMLEGGGYKVLTAADGKEGVVEFNRSGADLVITDIVMPEQEGIETIIQLKKNAPELKIMAISGGGRINPEGYLAMAKKLGAVQVLKKPIKRSELLAAVGELLPKD